MTLDEAIAKAKADGDVQLAEWLRQARGANAAARWYTEKLRDLRELVDYMTPIALYAASEQERDRMRELGVDA